MRESEAGRRYKFVVGLWLRVVAAAAMTCVLALFTLAGWAFPYSDTYLAYYGLALLMLSNGAYWLAGLAWEFPLWHFYMHWIVDLMLINMVVYGLGGSSLLPAITGYMLIVVSSAVFMSRRTAYMVATGGAVAFGGSSLAEMARWMQPSHGVADPRYAVGASAFVMTGSVVMVYLSAYIAGTLGDQLNRANEMLEMKNEELKHRNERLDELQKELEFQTRILTHDISSPIAATAAALGELRKELRDVVVGESALDLLRMADASVDRVHAMIDVLRAVQESGCVSDQKGVVDLAEVVETVADEMRGELQQKGVSLTVEGDLPAIVGSRQKWMVVFRNLFGNAIRYVPGNGSGRISVGMRRQREELRVFVADNGEGIPREYQGAIFEMFRKAPQKAASGGMGVGLALVGRIVEQHGGRVWAESDGESGAVFWIAVPDKSVEGDLRSS